MILIQASQKLLNTSRIKGAMLISKPEDGQLMHFWYARLIRTGVPGQLMTLYVHEPSMTVVLCRGKTIQRTWDEFRDRLVMLLLRHGFPHVFVQQELAMLNGYDVGKATNKKTIGRINHIVPNLEYHLMYPRQPHYATQDWLEDLMMDMTHVNNSYKDGYFTPIKFWRQELIF